MRVTTLGPALTTVTGTTLLFSSNTCVMPSLVPRMPRRGAAELPEGAIGSGISYWVLLLNVDVDARRQIDAHQGVNGLRRRVEDVDQALVSAHLEVFPRVLVLVRGPDDAIDVLLGRQRHRANDARARTGDRLDDLARRGINCLVVVGLQPDADLLSRHASPTSLLTGPRLGHARLARSSAIRTKCVPLAIPPLFICLWSTGPRARVCRPYAHSPAPKIRRDRGGDR